MKKLLPIMLISLAVLMYGNSYAKGKKVKFGKVSMDELKMTVYDADTSAAAVVLYHSGYYDGNNHKFYVFKRVKILKKNGVDKVKQDFYSSSRSDIKGKTFNLVNGEIIESKLDKENIFEEKIWDYKFKYNVAMPDVKVGSVVDLSYSFDGIPSRWLFQEDIPVVYNEFELGDSPYFTYRKHISGFLRPEEIGFNHWKAENMPAFISEPHMLGSVNYLSHVDVEILETHFPGYYPLNYTSSWKDVDVLLNKMSSFGKYLAMSKSRMGKYAREINEKATTEKDKAKLAVNKIKSLIEYNGRERFSASQEILDVLKDKKGGAGDINLCLVSLLREMNLVANPMVMSTRGNGLMPPTAPTLWGLDYVVAYVMIDGKPLILDATEKDLAWNVLPYRCLNYTGRVMDGHGSYKVDIMPKTKYIEKSYYQLKLDEDGMLSGNLSYANAGYSAYYVRDDRNEYLNDHDYAKSLMDAYDNLTINEALIENLKELDKPLKQKYTIELEDQLTEVEDQAYLNMFLMEKMDENPFKDVNRKYPVDFGYKKVISGTVMIDLGENYSVAQLPDPINMVLPENSGKFMMVYQNTGNNITLNYKIIINRTVFDQDTFAFIKQFYAQIVENQNKAVVLNIN